MKFSYEDVVSTLDWLHEEMGAPETLTDTDLAHLFADALIAMQDTWCAICDVNVMKVGEYYSVTNDLWKRYGVGRGMLCIGCLEERMGRDLTAADFADVPVNDLNFPGHSDRLRSRLSTSP